MDPETDLCPTCGREHHVRGQKRCAHYARQTEWSWPAPRVVFGGRKPARRTPGVVRLDPAEQRHAAYLYRRAHGLTHFRGGFVAGRRA